MTENIFDLEKFHQGQAATFDQLYDHHAPILYRLGWSMLQDERAAEDVVQETFLRAYKARKRFDPNQASLSTWLYQIGLNYCRSQLRRKQVFSFTWLGREAEQVPENRRAANPEVSLLQQEYQQVLWQGVNALSPRLQEVIILHYYLDFPAVEIAKTLECPEGTIYSRLHNARKRLADHLKRQGFALAEALET